jgi:hypothetical protein
MPRYFFDLYNAIGWTNDAEGVELSDDPSAYAQALFAARELIAEDITEGVFVNLTHFILVRNAANEEILRVHYRDAVRFIDPPPDS